ncbi:acetylcholine receptor subunit beta-like 1 [Babylonia areolata]|uniref:acetylcholine receptor subunit beta-like 1 n=1 Tax=Babylonia areolata TaxID=304850 RepID=UPI003FD33DBD
MKGYDPLVRPVVNFSQPVYLRLSMGLKSFIELDMKKQTLVFFGWLGVAWHDHFLRWDLDQFPFHKVQLTPDMVWRPDLVICNTMDDLDQLEDQKRKVIIESTGKVTWNPGGLFQTACSIDIFHYPLDTQTCSVEISTWSSSNEDIKVFADPAFEKTNSLETHPEWTIFQPLRYDRGSQVAKSSGQDSGNTLCRVFQNHHNLVHTDHTKSKLDPAPPRQRRGLRQQFQASTVLSSQGPSGIGTVYQKT